MDWRVAFGLRIAVWEEVVGDTFRRQGLRDKKLSTIADDQTLCELLPDESLLEFNRVESC